MGRRGDRIDGRISACGGIATNVTAEENHVTHLLRKWHWTARLFLQWRIGDFRQPRHRALLGGAKPARAQTISGNVPEVDRATVRVVTDNYHFALSPSGKIGDVEVGRVVFPLSDQPPEKVLLSEFGLSMHLETQRGNETRNVLIDFGYSSPTLLNNLDILGIDPAKLDAMVLSHGH